MAETKELFVNGARIGEVWAAFLSKLALKADKSVVDDLPTSEVVATAISTALTDYAKTSEVATAITTALEDYMNETEVNAAIASAVSGLSSGITPQPVETLPATGTEGIMYLVPKANSATNNVRDEYLWINNAWEIVGTTSIDLSNYYSKDELAPMTAEELAAILV